MQKRKFPLLENPPKEYLMYNNGVPKDQIRIRVNNDDNRG